MKKLLTNCHSPQRNGECKNHFFLRLALLVLTIVAAQTGWAASPFSWDLTTNTSKSTSNSDGVITIAFGGSNLSAQKTYMGFKNGSTLSISAASGYTITNIDFTYVSNYAPSDNSFTASPTGLNAACTNWSGDASSITISNTTSSNDTRIASVTVTYSDNTTGDQTTTFSVEDLRFEHQTYNPGRSGFGGFDITTSGWQSYTTVSGDDRIYTLLLSNVGSNNSITIEPNSDNSSRKIKQVILYGAGGPSTFNNATVTSANTRKYSDATYGAIIWENASGASSATISINSSDRPHISSIAIVTDGAMTWSKQSVALSFDPSSGTAATNQTDFSIDGRVKASIGGGAAEYFRPDEFTSSSVTNSNGSAATFNQFHISTGKVGVNTGASAGTATITATFAGNNFYEAATAGSYTLNIENNSVHTTTITVDDMRISKSNSNGLNATNDFDRVMGGFAFKFEGGDNVKFNNGDFLIFRNEGGKVTITPRKKDSPAGNIYITRVDINTLSGYTDGVVTVSGLTPDQTINGVSSYSFSNLSSGNGVTEFTMTTKSGDVFVTGFTIYYKDVNGVLNTTIVKPTFTFTPPSHTISTAEEAASYTSPTIAVNPGNFDFDITSDNVGVANVGTGGVISLQGETGTAHITASAAASTFFDAADNATYTVTVNSTNSKKWDFTTLDVTKTINDTEWNKSGDYYTNKFTTSVTTNGAAISSPAYYTTSNTGSQIYELLFGRQNTDGLSAGQIRLWSNYMTVNNSAVVIAVPVTAGQSVIVTFDGGNGSTQQGFDFTNATLEGDNTATSIKSDETQRVATLTAGTGGYITLKFTASKVKLYSIEVKDETRKTLTLSDINNTYNKVADSNATFKHNVRFTASDGATDALTYESDKDYLEITSSNSSVLDVTDAKVSATNFGSGSTFAFEGIKAIGAGTATLTITFKGNNNYKSTSYTSQVYTVSGALTAFAIHADDQAIQQGQRSPIDPVITNTSGQPIGIRAVTGGYETYVLGDEDDLPNYSDYFDFTYTPGSGSGTNYSHITVSDGTIETRDDTGIGATRIIAISATVKDAYKTAFGGTAATASTSITVTIRAKNAGINPCLYYWNSDLTHNEVTGPGDDKDYQIESSSSSMGIFGDKGTFAGGFPNGRMLYVKPKNADDVIFFTYAINKEPNDFPAQPTYDKKKHIWIYRRGIPIYIDDDITSESYVRVNIATASYDASTKKYTLNSSVVKMKFVMATHDRPDQPTYLPVSPDANVAENQDGRKIMNTSENVVAYGETDALVYGKFSTESVYTTEQLINEESVSSGTGSVPVVSTEVNKRRFTTVQIRKVTSDGSYGHGEYISEQNYTEYYYRFDTDLRLSYNNASERLPLTDFSINIGKNTPAVLYRVTWYNKRNYDDPKNYDLGVTQEVDNYTGTVTFSIGNTSADRSGATNVTVDPETGIVSAPNETNAAGWVRVKATYSGGEEHGGKSGEPQYKSTTDESVAYFTVYITDPDKKTPRIVPTTRNFAHTMKYQVQAPLDWDVRYTTDGSAPSKTNGTYLKHSTGNAYTSATDWIEIGSGMAVNEHITIQAIAYDPADNTTAVSSIVSETYTKLDAIPDPIFDPDGTKGNGYVYNTSSLTVQIACAKAGSVIYYTISDLNAAEKPDPVIGADNTYMYSGLSKVVVTGEKVIRAVAYDPVNGIYSNVVQSTYKYSPDMTKPYFQISNDDGKTWYGFSDATNFVENGTAWNDSQERAITPSTQIRIVDPNPVKGTIFYTLDGTTPSDDANSLVYSEGYPFTVGKTTTGKAIVILDDAKSGVATANFTINTATYGNVWEAVAETVTGEEGKKGLHSNEGFVISTDENLAVENTGTIVNLQSILGKTNAKGKTNTVSFAQQYITATFGGYDKASWEQMDIADKATGAPIGNVGEYSIKNMSDTNIGNGNAKDENGTNYNHIYSYKTEADRANTSDVTPATLHEKTFSVPAIGGYVRFEPERNGDLTIWCLQQGALLYEDDKYFVDNVLRIRPVYLIDEQGKSYPVKNVNGVPQLWSSARLSANWEKIQATAAANKWKDSEWTGEGDKYSEAPEFLQYIHLSDGKIVSALPEDSKVVTKLSDVPEDNEVVVVTKLSDAPAESDENYDKYYKILVNKGPNREETQALYNLYKAELDKNYVNIGDPIKPFPIHNGMTISMNDGRLIDTSDDGTGYVLPSGGYAKYTFEVKAGKTYYFFAQGSKIGIRGFQFVPTEDEDDVNARHEVTITKEGTKYMVDNDEKTPEEAVAACADKPANVTLSGRTFKADTWASLVLPFSVSVAQIEKVFGAYTDIVHFNDIKNWGNSYKLFLKRHWHKMVVAGTPILIKPTKQEVKDPVFYGVQLEASTVDEMEATTVKGQYMMTGVLTKSVDALLKDDYYINTNGELTHMTAEKFDVNATYAWIKYLGNPGAAKMLSLGFSSYEDDYYDEDAEITGIRIALYDETGIDTFTDDDSIYNLSGQKVGCGSLKNLPKGVYIVNGKKVVVK